MDPTMQTYKAFLGRKLKWIISRGLVMSYFHYSYTGHMCTKLYLLYILYKVKKVMRLLFSVVLQIRFRHPIMLLLCADKRI